jgi:Fur family ferric uptake transcriptional regulator
MPTEGARPSRRAERWEEMLRTHLESKGLKHSTQRLKIMKYILLLPGHFRVQDIAREIQSVSPGIGAATIYRNIKTLCEAGILRETLVDQDGQTVYELLEDDHHDHIVCMDCRQIFEFHEEGIEEIQNAITSRMKFSESQHRHVIYAHCDYLRAKKKN